MSASTAPLSESTPTREEGLGSAASRLGWRTILVYNLPTVGIGFMFLLVNMYLMKFATDVLLVAPAAMGLIFGLSRLWDAVTDPLAGYFSDRTSTRLGRRRPWLLASILPIGIAFSMLWSPPAGLGPQALVFWMAVGVFLFYSSMTIVIVPHTSLGAELSDNYHERTRLFGVRHVTWSLGSLAAISVMSILIAAPFPRVSAARMSLGAAIFTALLLLIAVIGLRERPEYQGRGAHSPFKAFSDVLRNPHARRLLLVFLIESLGGATIGILTPYVGQYIVGTPELTPVYILLYIVPSILSVPLWVVLSRHFGKKALWILAMLITSFGFGAMFLLGEGDVALISGLAVFLGFGAGCGAVVAPSIQADIIDFDEYQTGQRKEGAYFAAWNLVFKTATGVTLMLTGFILQAAGFVPNAEQSEQARFALLALYALFPMACYLIGTLIFMGFSLNEAEHQEIRAALQARRGPRDD